MKIIPKKPTIDIQKKLASQFKKLKLKTELAMIELLSRYILNYDPFVSINRQWKLTNRGKIWTRIFKSKKGEIEYELGTWIWDKGYERYKLEYLCLERWDTSSNRSKIYQ